MAKIISPVWAIIRGSIAGTTYMANQFHQIIARAKTSPVNPNTNFQTTVRSAFAAAEAAWKGLTDDQRGKWDEYAGQTPRQNPLGPITLTGRLFARGIITLRQYLVGQYGTVFTPQDTAPLTPGMLTIDHITTVAPAGPGTGVGCSFNNPAGNGDINIMVNISQAFEGTRKFFSGPWDTSSTGISTTPDASQPIISFLGLVEDKIYFLRIRCIQKVGPHKITEEFILRAIAEVVV